MTTRVSMSPSERFGILTRDRFTCRYCGRKSPNVELHVDHIHPVVKGGTNSPDNLCAACVECNLSKKDKLIGQHLPMPADDAPLAERVAHLKLEMKRRFKDYDERVPAEAFTAALESGSYRLSAIIHWLDENNGRQRFVDAMIRLASFGHTALENRRARAEEEAGRTFISCWGDALRELLAVEQDLDRDDPDGGVVGDGSWSAAMSGVFAEACGEDEASDYSHIYYSLFLRALESGVSRRDLLSIGPREGRWGGATIVCSIAELTECALLERSSDPPAHLSLIHGGAE